jgi:hypothetical protein
MAPSLAAYIGGVLPDVVAAALRRGWFRPEDVRAVLNREFGVAPSRVDDGRIAAALAARDEVRGMPPDGTRWRADRPPLFLKAG